MSDETRWGTGYGKRRHIVHPEPTVVHEFGRDHTVWFALCSGTTLPTVLDFIAGPDGRAETRYGPVEVMGLEPCKKCERLSALVESLPANQENTQ